MLPVSPMPTGNGYGFAVYSPKVHAVTKFYSHPYRFMRQDPQDPHADGPTSLNLVKRLAWDGDPTDAVEYRNESNVILNGHQSFYMPFGLKRNVLVTSDQASPHLSVEWAQNGAVEETETLSGRQVRVISFKGTSDTVAMVPLDKHGWAIVNVDRPGDVPAAVSDVVGWQHGDSSERLVERETAALEQWRVRPPSGLAPDELTLWRQSETVIRMAQVQEPGPGHGLLLASLPDGEWFISWVRDMSYATRALSRMGHQQEARESLDGELNARPMGSNKPLTRNVDYQISTVRYNGDGSEMADLSGMPAPNVEFDSWGEALTAMGEYVQRYNDVDWLKSDTWRGTVYETMRDYIARPLMENLDPYQGGLIVAPDTSTWEQNDQDRRHYSASTIWAIAGLRGFKGIAEKMGDTQTVAAVQDKLDLLQRGFEAAFVPDGRIHGVLEVKDTPKNDVDAATLEAINLGVETNPDVIARTIDSMSVLKEPPGGIRRVTGDTSYEKHEFVWSDFALIQATHAKDLLATIVSRSKQDHNLIAEMYVSVPNDGDFPGNIGDPTGSIPMVGFGAGQYINTLLRRQDGEPAPRLSGAEAGRGAGSPM